MTSRPPLLRRSAVGTCGEIRALRILAYTTLMTFFIMFAASFFAPWTQTSSGEGRVVAFSPIDRETPIRAPIEGRITSWLVVEGERVERGQILAEMVDNDPQILDRLGRMRDATINQARAIDAAALVAKEQVRALAEAREAAVSNARAKIDIAINKRQESHQQLEAALAAEKTAAINLERQRNLNEKGLASDRDFELATLADATAKSKRLQAEASLRSAEREVEASRARLDEVREKHTATYEKARAELSKVEAEASKVAASTELAESKLSRQQNMQIAAPRSGRILSIRAREGSDFVKAGESLAILVPETGRRAVEIWIDGNDAPLVTEDREVRLQFEGWPAVQFVGWPSVAVGTFGGKVAFIDPASRADGKFRVMVLPNPDDEPWPDDQYLRQGVRARGWILLNRVSVAFELWRQFNGFPPALPEGGNLLNPSAK